jgi:hypothetical protein
VKGETGVSLVLWSIAVSLCTVGAVLFISHIVDVMNNRTKRREKNRFERSYVETETHRSHYRKSYKGREVGEAEDGS